MFNPLQLQTCFQMPERLSGVTPWIPHIPFAFALVEALRPQLFVELGTHRGDSYCGFCQAIKDLKLPARCFAVDTWQGDEHAGEYGPEILSELIEYHDPRYGEFSKLLPMTFDEAHGGFSDGTIDLLHIDGLHTYEAVKHDFDNWLPKVSDRGVVLFHDILVRERDFGVWKLWDELRLIYPHFSLNHAYGLGVLIVGGQAPEAVHELAATAKAVPGFDRFFDALGSRVTLLEGIRRNEAWIREQSVIVHEQRNELVHRAAQLAHSQQLHAAAQQEVQGCRTEIERLAHVICNHTAELQRQVAFIAQLTNEKAADAAAHAEIVAMQAAATTIHSKQLAEQDLRLSELTTMLDQHRLALAESQTAEQRTAQLLQGTMQQLQGTTNQLICTAQELANVRGYYNQMRFRLAERLNNSLRRLGVIHTAIRSVLLALGRAERRISPPRPVAER